VYLFIIENNEINGNYKEKESAPSVLEFGYRTNENLLTYIEDYNKQMKI
jgi:hypothetical protein